MLHISIQFSQILFQWVRQYATQQCSSPHPSVFEPGTFRTQALCNTYLVLMSHGDSSVSGISVFYSNQSTLLKPYNLKNKNCLSLTAVIFFSFSSFSLPHIFINSKSHPTHIVTNGYRCLHPAVKRSERAAGHIPQPSAEVKNEWNSNSTSLQASKTWKGTTLLTLAPLLCSLHCLHCCLSQKRYSSASFALQVGGQT